MLEAKPPSASVVHPYVEDCSKEFLRQFRCDKEPARRIQSPLLEALDRKEPLVCDELVLYGIRDTGVATLSTNLSRASLSLNQ